MRTCDSRRPNGTSSRCWPDARAGWSARPTCCTRYGVPGYDRETNYLRVFMAQLRRKLEKDPARPTLFITDPGIGYRLTVSLPSHDV